MRTILVAGLALFAAPASASAVTVVRVSDVRPGPPKSESTYADVVLTGDDHPSDLVMERDLDQGDLIVYDPYGVVPGQNCASVPETAGTSVRCPLRGLTWLSGEMTAGGGNDRIDVTGSIDVDAGAGEDVVKDAHTALGGEGDDDLAGSRVDGGSGADVLRGNGFSLVDLSRRTRPVRFSLVDGEEGEGDRVMDMGGLIGGSSDDVLTGSPGDDVMLGGPGDDEIESGDGNDALADWIGHNTLVGERGDDTLVTDAASRVSPELRALSPFADGPPRPAEGRALLLAGQGDDTVISGPGADRLDPGEGHDTVTTFVPAVSGGTDTVWLRDGGADTLICDRRSSVRADARDHLARCERIERTGPARPRLVFAGDPRGGDGNRGSMGTAFVGCSDDHGSRCRGLIRVYVLDREVGRQRFSIAPGTFDSEIRFPLAPSVFDAVGQRGQLRSFYRVDTRDARGRALVLRGQKTLCSGRQGVPSC